MNIKYKEDPQAWRKSTLLSVIALLLLLSFLRWRQVVAPVAWGVGIGALVCIGILAWIKPKWFRGYYRFSTWAGFWSSQAVARVILAIMFGVLIIPAGLVMRLLGKDPLHLKRPRNATTLWTVPKQSKSLDRSF